MARLIIERTERLIPRWNLSDSDRLEILKGSVKPDRSLDVFILPHYYHRSGKKILERIETMIYEEKFYPKETGYILHYLMDYSTTVHKSRGLYRPKEHLAYEKKLHHFFLEHRRELKRTEVLIPDKNLLVWTLREMIEHYQSIASNFKIDLEYAYRLSIMTLYHMVI